MSYEPKREPKHIARAGGIDIVGHWLSRSEAEALGGMLVWWSGAKNELGVAMRADLRERRAELGAQLRGGLVAQGLELPADLSNDAFEWVVDQIVKACE